MWGRRLEYLANLLGLRRSEMLGILRLESHRVHMVCRTIVSRKLGLLPASSPSMPSYNQESRARPPVAATMHVQESEVGLHIGLAW